MLRRSSKYRDVKLNALITSAWLSPERFFMKSLSKQNKNKSDSYETGSMTGILEELRWETLQKRRKDNRHILMYKDLKGNARIPTDDLIPKNRRCRNQH